jgi:hypothetical protein
LAYNPTTFKLSVAIIKVLARSDEPSELGRIETRAQEVLSRYMEELD